MSSVRQEARRKALAAKAQRRREQRERDQRLSALAVAVAVALEERDGAIDRYEGEAGAALHELVQVEGVKLADVPTWVPGLRIADARRLVRVAGEQH